MPAIIAVIAGLIVGTLIGIGVGYLLRRRSAQHSLEQAEEDARQLLTEAETRSRELELETKEDALRLRNEAEADIREWRSELSRMENRLSQREENLDRKAQTIETREEALHDRSETLRHSENELEDLRAEQLRTIERVSGLGRDEARNQLLAAVDEEIREEAGRRVREMERDVESTAATKAQKIIATAIQRYAGEVTAETTVSVVPIGSDDMKGRLIGREGRNIRAIEAATGVDLIIDDTPDAVTISSFDPVRREVARVALAGLVEDGRIHPTRIEEAVSKAQHNVDSTMAESAEQAATEADVLNLAPDVMKVFGRLRYRTSYGQNVMRHSVETAHIAAMIAQEVGADENVARAGGFLHDLGKAVDHEVEGTHALIGADIARRYGVRDEVAHCIEAHHEEVPPSTVEAVIVQMADAISGGRPGARRESLDSYVKRLETLEQIAKEHNGVEQAFAIQAGRELRIVVSPEQVDDLESMRIARDVSQKIEESVDYPGQIKVTVVRETRATEYAR
ncbi:MAG: ribonuclease Y [Dehalococcoidia bacterium]|nr:ribonuclease Y [Dehalococcoidia bacterium]|tara:strand:- start:1653 stop:3185 length:1533 start_codon:yes stop_codon:yes gene_type:complete